MFTHITSVISTISAIVATVPPQSVSLLLRTVSSQPQYGCRDRDKYRTCLRRFCHCRVPKFEKQCRILSSHFKQIQAPKIDGFSPHGPLIQRTASMPFVNSLHIQQKANGNKDNSKQSQIPSSLSSLSFSAPATASNAFFFSPNDFRPYSRPNLCYMISAPCETLSRTIHFAAPVLNPFGSLYAPSSNCL
ncbi:hypothetical protein HDV57DRAFT_167738 [Trichoderma longibrachiatum]|uniref:Uncharacterized protein n=1 Tax=Trichoderma longibrachiatum ATCC 18648 TaxID=983965 RepID=A0A2T4CA47_TRILO|nr:hypothetical protein M440DRAFT_260120 [Trichoderma longibrachiatum ATCC 18648]